MKVLRIISRATCLLLLITVALLIVAVDSSQFALATDG